MKNINKVQKTKEKLLFELESLDELKTIDYKKLIPSDAKQIEITYSDRIRILKIDYILNLVSRKMNKEEY